MSKFDDFNYKFNEGKSLAELEEYLKSTYNGHYSSEKYQATDMIMDAGHGIGFCIGNIMKYAKRFGKKGGYNKMDLMKIIHYTMLAMYDAEQKGLFPIKIENKATGLGGLDYKTSLSTQSDADEKIKMLEAVGNINLTEDLKIKIRQSIADEGC